jgi:hypothetical protein
MRVERDDSQLRFSAFPQEQTSWRTGLTAVPEASETGRNVRLAARPHIAGDLRADRGLRGPGTEWRKPLVLGLDCPASSSVRHKPQWRSERAGRKTNVFDPSAEFGAGDAVGAHESPVGLLEFNPQLERRGMDERDWRALAPEHLRRRILSLDLFRAERRSNVRLRLDLPHHRRDRPGVLLRRQMGEGWEWSQGRAPGRESSP